MSITLELTPDQVAELERRAAILGTNLQDYVRELVEDQLEAPEDVGSHELPYHQWREEFRSWLAGRKPRNPNVDDSRESIYD